MYTAKLINTALQILIETLLLTPLFIFHSVCINQLLFIVQVNPILCQELSAKFKHQMKSTQLRYV